MKTSTKSGTQVLVWFKFVIAIGTGSQAADSFECKWGKRHSATGVKLALKFNPGKKVVGFKKTRLMEGKLTNVNEEHGEMPTLFPCLSGQQMSNMSRR